MENNSKLIKMLKEAGIEIGEEVKCEINPKHNKAVEEFIIKIEEAYKITKNSRLRFDYSILTNIY